MRPMRWTTGRTTVPGHLERTCEDRRAAPADRLGLPRERLGLGCDRCARRGDRSCLRHHLADQYLDAVGEMLHLARATIERLDGRDRDDEPGVGAVDPLLKRLE